MSIKWNDFTQWYSEALNDEAKFRRRADDFAQSQSRETIPVTYHVQVAPELSRMLEVYAAAESKKPETIIAEALRRYLGVDA